jgi:hypothetical protein
MTDKSGGDVLQGNLASQGNVSGQQVAGVASAGPAILDSVGGGGVLGQFSDQAIQQALAQANIGAGGTGGSDNIHADTNISV